MIQKVDEVYCIAREFHEYKSKLDEISLKLSAIEDRIDKNISRDYQEKNNTQLTSNIKEIMYNFEKNQEYKFEKLQSNKLDIVVFDNKSKTYAPIASLDNLRLTIHEFLNKVEDNLKNNFTSQFSDLRFKLDQKLDWKDIDSKISEFLKNNDEFNINLEN